MKYIIITLLVLSIVAGFLTLKLYFDKKVKEVRTTWKEMYIAQADEAAVKIEELEEYSMGLWTELNKRNETIESLRNTIKNFEVKHLVPLGKFKTTAYDLSVQSCGKTREHPEYGITASGYSLKGMDRKKAMTIAVDPKVIPLGSKLYVEIYNPKYAHLSGVYTARDTGGLIKGRKIDIFFGEGDKDLTADCMKYGVQDANIYLLKGGK